MADTQFVNNKPLIFDCDLDLGGEKLNFVHNNLLIFLYLFMKFDKIPFIGF